MPARARRQPLGHEQVQRVRAVLRERGAGQEARRAIQGERLGLRRARLQLQLLETEPACAPLDRLEDRAPEAQATPEVVDGGAAPIWYVVANSVNVRAEPSTDADVLGKLGSGEAALLVQAVNDDWARIVIQGDGVEGFVAMRYLSPEAP